MQGNIIGRLERICRYPVKSMSGEDVDAIYVHETGLNGDRVYAFYDHESRRNGLPYLTGREKRELLLLRPKITDEPDITQPYPDAYQPQVMVDMPDEKRTYDVMDPGFIHYIREICSPKDLSITLDYRKAGIHDSKPVSIIGLRTVEQLAYESGITELDPKRFRENFYVDWDSDEPFFEDSLIGKSLKIGDELVLHIVKRNARCVMIGIDPDSAEYDKRILGIVAKKHESCTGIYGVVRKPGVARLGDPIVVC